MLQRLTDALPSEIQVHTFGGSGDIEEMVAALDRVQGAMPKLKTGTSWKKRDIVKEKMEDVGDAGMDEEEVVHELREYARSGGGCET